MGFQPARETVRRQPPSGPRWRLAERRDLGPADERPPSPDDRLPATPERLEHLRRLILERRYETPERLRQALVGLLLEGRPSAR